MMPLIEAAALAEQLGRSDLKIADVRWKLGEPDYGQKAHLAGHIPGSIFVDLETDLRAARGSGRHPLPDPTDFARRLEQLGFGDEDHIVAIDDAGGAIAARLWWMLDDLGHSRVQVLNGGLAGWLAANLPWTEAPTEIRKTRMQGLRTAWSRMLDRRRLKASHSALQLLDARAPERFQGLEEPVDPAAGHIPGASNVPFTSSLDRDSRFLPPEILAELLEGLKGDARETVVYCGSGVTACHLALAYRVAGLGSPLLYPGSWSDWSTAGEEIETGP